MNISRSILLLAAICGPLGCAALGQAPASARGFDVYHIVTTRNIFDPDRSPFSNYRPPAPRPAYSAPKAPDFVALTGVMVTSEKALAFFSGSRSDYDKVVPVNGDIAGAKLTKISAGSIEVERAGKKIDVGIGQTVPLDGSAPGAAPAFTASESAPPAADGQSDGAAPVSGNLNDVMRRMMERRQQQLK